MSDVCAGCDHSLSRHFVDVTGVVRCLVTESGHSTSGVIGLPWSVACDCADYRSKQANYRRAVEAKERAEHDAVMAEFAAAFPAVNPVSDISPDATARSASTQDVPSLAPDTMREKA